jgi:hypothetical protein
MGGDLHTHSHSLLRIFHLPLPYLLLGHKLLLAHGHSKLNPGSLTTGRPMVPTPIMMVLNEVYTIMLSQILFSNSIIGGMWQIDLKGTLYTEVILRIKTGEMRLKYQMLLHSDSSEEVSKYHVVKG